MLATNRNAHFIAHRTNDVIGSKHQEEISKRQHQRLDLGRLDMDRPAKQAMKLAAAVASRFWVRHVMPPMKPDPLYSTLHAP